MICIRKPGKCPICGGKVGTILYGYRIIDEKMEADIEAGKFVIGGCCITDNDPTWQCTQCGLQIWKGGAGIVASRKVDTEGRKKKQRIWIREIKVLSLHSLSDGCRREGHSPERMHPSRGEAHKPPLQYSIGKETFYGKTFKSS